MAKALRSFQAGISTREAICRANSMGLESITGKMGATTKAISQRACGQAMDSGRKDKELATNTRVNFSTTRSTDTVYIPGVLDMFTRATTRIICGMDTGKCIGRTAASTRETGN
jgi:hypothetical protein